MTALDNLRFPASPASGGPEHAKAIGRLESALAERDRARERLDAAMGTAGEFDASNVMSDVCDRLAARQAWVQWIEGDAF